MKRLSYATLSAIMLFMFAACQNQTDPLEIQTDDDIALWTKDDARCLLGYEDELPAGVNLPDRIYLKTRFRTHNRAYYFAVEGGQIYAKVNEERTGEEGEWVKLNLPDDLEGRAIEIGADDINLIAINDERKVFTMNGGLGPMSLFWWSDKWGSPVWLGPGINLQEEYIDWSYSVISPGEDKKYIDPAGNLHPVGGAKVSHIWVMEDQGQTLTYLDPWLPCDYSYRMDTPYRGRFKAAGMSSSGSTVFIINKYGDMFTRLYDFDMVGCDRVFFRYSYEDQRGKIFPAIQLPGFDWTQQPKINGTITDNISVYKVGKNAIHRILRVEGTDAEGHTGFWQKDVTDTASDAWVFHRTDAPLEGNTLDNSNEDLSKADLAASTDLAYSREMKDGWEGSIPNLNCYSSPARFCITTEEGDSAELILHTIDGLRQDPREPGFDSNPRKQYATIEVPEELRDRSSLPASIQAWMETYLDDEVFTDYMLYATDSEALFKKGNHVNGVFKTTGIEMTFIK